MHCPPALLLTFPIDDHGKVLVSTIWRRDCDQVLFVTRRMAMASAVAKSDQARREFRYATTDSACICTVLPDCMCATFRAGKFPGFILWFSLIVRISTALKPRCAITKKRIARSEVYCPGFSGDGSWP